LISAALQPFESSIFGGPVARLSISGACSAAEIGDCIDRFRRQDGLKLASARIPAADEATARALEVAGFVRVETLVTLTRPCAGAEPPMVPVELAVPDEAAICAEIGRVAFIYDRFHADTRLDRQAADTLKAQWVANGVSGRADAPLVVRRDGRPVGFNLCMRSGETAVIDLIAVHPDHHGRGLGRALVLGALDHYRRRGISTMTVGTQVDNGASFALYRGLGFVETSRAATFHLVP